MHLRIGSSSPRSPRATRALLSSSLWLGAGALAGVLALGCAPAEPAPAAPRGGGSASSGAGGGQGASASGGSSGSLPAGTGGQTSAGGGASDCSAGAGDDLITDFEDGTGDLPPSNGRAGGWYAYNDMTPGGMQTPAPTLTASIAPSMLSAPRCGGSWALHVRGSGFTNWGAGIGTNLNAPYDSAQMRSLKTTYDAGAYRGIAFWARVEQGSTPSVRVQLPSIDTDPDGGRCRDCNNHFGKNLTLSTTWQRYVILFAEARQAPGWGEPVARLDTSKLFAIQLQFDRSQTFDLWIDDVALVR